MATDRTDYNRNWRKTHPELVHAQNQRSYAKNAEKCRKYSREYARNHKEQVKIAQKKWREENKERCRVYAMQYHRANKPRYRGYRLKLKMSCLNAYGSTCACCGESKWEFLTIDHIKGGGTRHREELKTVGSAFYQWLKNNNFPSGYRVLCYNCNCCLGQHGYCAHVQRR